MRIGIVGHGAVGSAMTRFFDSHPNRKAVVYDKFRPSFAGDNDKAAVNGSDLVFLCVPTPRAADGMSCDVSAVEECLEWILPPICIRSTVVPGTVNRLTAKTGKALAFSPEYLGESPNHPWREEADCGFLIVGGEPATCDLVVKAYSDFPNKEIKCFKTNALTAELCKYMENCFLATKVAFVNQFHDIAQAYEVDFGELRDLWLLDPRVGLSHSSVTAERGFRGRCLPKDLAAIAAAMRTRGGAPLLEAVLAFNHQIVTAADKCRKNGSEAA